MPPSEAGVFSLQKNPSSNKKHVVFFGETGVGKSSVINLILGENVAASSPYGKSGTLEHTSYEHTIDKQPYRLYDTVGVQAADLQQVGDGETVHPVRNLLELLEKLEPDGVHLVVLVINGGSRLTQTTTKNYALLRHICGTAIPIALVVTRCENEPEGMDMQAWWRRERPVFERQQISFKEVACVTADRPNPEGPKILVDRYAQSQTKVARLITEASLLKGYKVHRPIFAANGKLKAVLNFFGFSKPLYDKMIYESLVNCGINPTEARKIVDDILSPKK